MATKQQRSERLMPNGIPRYIRCYDNGGPDKKNGSIDRYTVAFTGRAATSRTPGRDSEHPYLGMSAYPFHPQGFGQHGFSKGQPCDVNKSGWPPAMGKTNHLGKRIPFTELPEDCRTLVINDYKEIWSL